MDFVGALANSSTSTSHGDNGPILYLENNRTAVVEDLRSVLINIAFFTLFVALVVISPGIRSKERLPTIVCLMLSLSVGVIIMNAAFGGTTWHVAEAHVSAPYKAFSRDKIFGELRVKIGLNSVNITLTAIKLHSKTTATTSNRNNNKQLNNIKLQTSSNNHQHATTSESQTTVHHISNNNYIDINYNERFSWVGPKQMIQEFYEARKRGLPYPILTVIDYLSQDDAGFSWMRKYRQAGYYCGLMLWLSIYLWILMMVLHCAAPRYGVYTMQLLGCTLITATLNYALQVPSGHRRLVIPFENQELSFDFGFSFWSVLFAGCVSLVCGSGLAIIDWMFPNQITTILYVDFDAHTSLMNRRRREELLAIDKESASHPQTSDATTTENSVVVQNSVSIASSYRERGLNQDHSLQNQPIFEPIIAPLYAQQRNNAIINVKRTAPEPYLKNNNLTRRLSTTVVSIGSD